MHVRVVRFTGVTQERVDSMLARVEEAGGPPPDIPAIGLQMLFDPDQGTAIVLQMFATAEDLRAGDAAFGAMDPGETPGVRASVDMGELLIDRRMD